MTTKMNVYYRAKLETSKEYATLSITVYRSATSGSTYGRPMVTLSFQANLEDGADNLGNWYAGKLETEASQYEDIMETASLAKRIVNKDGYSIKLADVLANLEKIGTEVTYDGRMHGNVPLDEVFPSDYVNWADKESYPEYGCLVRTEQEAQKKIIEKAVNRKNFDYVTRFIENGRQVYKVHNGYGYSEPDRETIRERIAKLG